MSMMPPGGPPTRVPPTPGGPLPPVGGGPSPILQGIMRMLPPQIVQMIATNPAVIPQLVQRVLPMVLGGMTRAPMGAPGGVPPRGQMPIAAGGGQQGILPPAGQMPAAGGAPPGLGRRPPPPRRPPAPGGAPPAAFTGNSPPQPPAQGALGPTTEDELAMTQQNMGKRPLR